MGSLRDFARVKQVGKGAFGVAWLVEAKSGGQRFVIKELGQKEMSEKERLEARKEVMFLAKMNHPNIVSYYNSFEENGRVHILMEFCENGDLGARIKSQNGILFKEDQILDYFVQICHGIKHIHDNKILHRDIKPQNIFLTKTNVVKLGDFGIAKLMNSTTAFTNTTVGTPFYFSPELCSRRMYNNKSDIWSLGCVLYELCTLNHAFSAQEMAILALRIKNVSYKPISMNYSSSLRLLISSIFQRDPRERPNINEILKKPFIARIIDKSYPQNSFKDSNLTSISGKYLSIPKTPRLTPVKDINQRRPSPAVVGRVNSGLNNRKVINKENLMENSPYLPPSKKPMMMKKQENNKVNALVIKKNELSKRKRAAMIINDRENAWRNVLVSPDESKEKVVQEVLQEDPKEKVEGKVLGRYDNYHADLERLKQQQELREMEGKQLMHRFHKISDEDNAEGVYRKIDLVKNNIQLGVNAADRDRLVQEYWENKQKAMQNRNRNGAGVALALCGARKIDIRHVPAASDLNHDEEMSERLNKIRQRNAEEKSNQNIVDFNLNYDKDKGVILNKENARIALEDLQKKIKLRSEELHQKLVLKRFEKEKETDVENQMKNEQQIVPSNDIQNRPNNVVLFPKRADPFAPYPKIIIDENKFQNPRITNILNQIKDIKPSDEQNVEGLRKDVQVSRLPTDLQSKLNNVIGSPKEMQTSPRGEVEDIKVKDPRMTNIIEQIKNVKPYGDEVKVAWKKDEDEDIKMVSLSVVLNKLRDEPSIPRPCTAPPAENLEIKKIKTDILKRLNKKQSLLDEVQEENNRKSWVLDFDDACIKKDENADNLDDTVKETDPVTDEHVMYNKEDHSPRPKWYKDLTQVSDFSLADKPSKGVWMHNKDFPINLMINEEEDTFKEDNLEGTIKLDGTTVMDERNEIESQEVNDAKNTTELKEAVQDSAEEVEDISSVIIEEYHNIGCDLQIFHIKTDAWEKKSPQIIETNSQVMKKEDMKQVLQSSLSSEDDKDEVSVYMRRVLEIKSDHSSEEEKYTEVEDDTEVSEYAHQLTEARSMPDLFQIKDIKMKKTKSESYLNKSIIDDESEEDEDFSDDKAEDENIFLKIEMIRDKLEREIGLDPLIDAMEFVRESQDLDGDDLTARLRVMLDNNEDAVNDIIHLVVLEEQYNNMD